METLRRGESTVSRLQRYVLGAVWFDALDMQSKIRWGAAGPQAVVLEGDEKNFKSKVEVTEDGRTKHKFRPYLLFTERGDNLRSDLDAKTQIFVLTMGMTESKDHKRFPKITEEMCSRAMTLAKIGEHASVVWMSDGGADPASGVKSALRRIPNIVQHETVDHSGKMYARSCLVKDFQLPNGEWTWRQGVAGDNKCVR